MDKASIVIKFDKVPNSCNECLFYKNTFYVDEEPFFGDGIHHYCPFGASAWGCLIERPENCPIGQELYIYNFDKQGNFDFS